MALQVPAGIGKTMSSSLMAYGLWGNWTKNAVMHSKNNFTDLYVNLGEDNVLPLKKLLISYVETGLTQVFLMKYHYLWFKMKPGFVIIMDFSIGEWVIIKLTDKSWKHLRNMKTFQTILKLLKKNIVSEQETVVIWL